jgi:aminoglycoside phosphotransferase (APT) family kinase protein
MYHANLSADTARELLRTAGVHVPVEKLTVERRERRWILNWADPTHLAWLPADADGAAQLDIENRMLTLVAKHCSFAVPRTLYFDPANGLAIRTRIPGAVDPEGLYQRMRRDPALGGRIGQWLGRALAELHAIPVQNVSGWLPARPSWPEPLMWIRENLPEVLDAKSALLPRLNALLRHYEVLIDRQHDPVPAHTDLGLHNLVVDPESGLPRGVIDFDAAAYVDRHLDFRYFVFNTADNSLLERALKSYYEATGRTLETKKVYLHNALSACSYLANRVGHDASEAWYGRTLAEDLAWVDMALRRVGL